jgi:HEAT repeat protein
LIRSHAPGVAVASIEALRTLGDPTVNDLLNETLQHQDEEVVKQALIAIKETVDASTVQHLRVGLEHPAWDVRLLATELLAQINDPSAAQVLLKRLETETDELVSEAIKQALGKLGEVS